jgi:arylsulfatase A-like enzyme
MPNRASMFTGMFPRNHGVWTNGLLPQGMPPLLGDLMAAAGFRTASIGKLHFGPYGGDAGNRESLALWKRLGDGWDWNGPYGGFEHVELTIGHTAPVAHYGRWFRARGGTPEMRVELPSGARDMPPELHDSIFVGERTAAFVRENRARPFFVFASFPDPHHPFDPPLALAEKYRVRTLPPPIGGAEDLATRPPHYLAHFRGGWHRRGPVPEEHPEGPDAVTVHHRRANTLAMVELIDRGVGMILDALDEEGLRERTLVIFTSDHGELLGDHGLWYKGPFFYEGLLGVPLLVSGPGIEAGVTDALVSTVDLAPTILDLAGARVPTRFDGISIAPHLRDRRRSTRDRCLVEYRTGYVPADHASAALVTRDLKYVRYDSGERELTDLAADPQERVNLAADPRAARTAEQLESRLLTELLSTGSRWPEQISHA